MMKSNIVTNNNEPQQAQQPPNMAGGLSILAIILMFIVVEATAIVLATQYMLSNFGTIPAIAVASVLMVIFGLLFN